MAEDGVGWYFDSFGIQPHVPDHVSRIKKNCKRLRWCNVRVQSSLSSACGKYCIMFLYYMINHWGVRPFLKNFTTDLGKNGKIADEFVDKL